MHPRPLHLLVAYWCAAAVIAVLGAWSIQRWGVVRPLYGGEYQPGRLLAMWTRFDGGWYSQIATDGYSYDPDRQSPIVFFPTYPLVMAALVRLGLNPFAAGSLITVLSTSAAIMMFWRWQRDTPVRDGVETGGAAAPLLGTLAWLLYPYAFFLYGAVYSDALFALVTITSFWLLDRGRPMAAGVLGIAATAARPFGWAVTVGLVIRAVERRWSDRTGEELTPTVMWRRPREVLGALRPVDAGVTISGLGVVAYLIYLWVRFDSPLVFVTNEQHWGQGARWSILTKEVFWHTVTQEWRLSPLAAVTLIAQAVIGLGLLGWGTVAVHRRYGLGMAAYLAVTVAPAVLFTKDFQGMGRYALAAFPAFAVLGPLLARHLRIARFGLAASGLVLVFLSSLYAQGHYLS